MIDAKAAAADDLCLSSDELVRLTGCKRPTDQVAELVRQGFHRARRARDGSVVLERAHYDAVCRGFTSAANEPSLRP